MKGLLLSLLLITSVSMLAQTPAPTSNKPASCLAVVDAGSHGLRNFMLGGIAGALLSKKQYKIVAAVGYPAKVGQKMHGSDLQTLQVGGTRIMILDKKYTKEELRSACPVSVE